MAEQQAFYAAWAELLEWMREYATAAKGAVQFVKQADFTDYIYRMERDYDLPTTIMAASLSTEHDEMVLYATASPRHALFKEVVLHPFGSHVYRSLTIAKGETKFTEGPREFTKAMLFALMDSLLNVRESA